ncbi:MAG: S-layer homology domain-containing protein [Candidatus Gracilibacteria bacterium]
MVYRFIVSVGVFILFTMPAYAATFTVDSASDTGDFNTADGVCDTDDSVGDGPCTLRAAISQANFDASLDTITFNLAGPGPFVFTPATEYDDFIEPVFVDGTSQPGVSCGTDPVSRNLLLSVDFSSTGGSDGFGFTSNASGSSLRGMNLFGATGVHAIGVAVDNVTIGCNNIGTTLDGSSVAISSNGYGILAEANNLTIGGSSFADMNIISGSSIHGIEFQGGDNLVIAGNYIGTDITGVNAIANAQRGINIYDNGLGVNDATIGGMTVASRNIISANSQGGISVDSAVNTLIQNNYVGLNVHGNALGNGNFGVLIQGTTSGVKLQNNVVSGNIGPGVVISDGSNISIEGNLIGTSPDGLSARPNDDQGILNFTSFANLRIGGADPSQRNIISGNNATGILIVGDGKVLIIEGNYVGTDITGGSALPNGESGIIVADLPKGVRIGGISPGSGNVVSGNIGVDSHGILVLASGSIIQGNIVGLDASGTSALPNDAVGILIFEGATDVLVGGDIPAARNVVSANGLAGIAIGSEVAPAASNNRVQGNYIGTDINGNPVVGLGNGPIGGIVVPGYSEYNVIGGVNPGEENLISGDHAGIRVMSLDDIPVDPADNSILRNTILTGTLPIDHAIDTSSPPDFLPDDFIGQDTNDAFDADSGPNDLLNQPVFTNTTTSGGNVQVDYSLDVPAGDYRIEFFSDGVFVSSDNITHAGAGSESFNATLTGVAGTTVAATATEILTVPATCDSKVYYSHQTETQLLGTTINPLGADVYELSFDLQNSAEADRFEEILEFLSTSTGARAMEYIPAATLTLYFHEGIISNVVRVDSDTISVRFDLSVANDVAGPLAAPCVDPYNPGDYTATTSGLRAQYDAMTIGQTTMATTPAVELLFEVHTFDSFTSRFGATSEFSSSVLVPTTTSSGSGSGRPGSGRYDELNSSQEDNEIIDIDVDGDDMGDDNFKFTCSDIFNDTSGSLYEEDICFLYNIGVLQGRGSIDGIDLPRDPEEYSPDVDHLRVFSPNAAVNRVEFLKMILRYPGLNLFEKGNESSQYNDVALTDWFYHYIDAGTELNIVEGYDNGSFNPGKDLINAEALAMLARAGEQIPSTLTDGERHTIITGVEQFFEENMDTLSDNEIIESLWKKSFSPQTLLSRGQAANIIRAVFYPDSFPK